MFKRMSLFAFIFTMVLVIPAAAQVPSYVPTDGLVGWWPFNGNANDESGNGNDGVVNGATLTEDRFGNADSAYFFNGTNSFIEVPNNQQINNLPEVSVGYWVNINQFPQINVFNGFAGCVTKWFQSPFCNTDSDHFGLWIGNDSTFKGGTRLYSGGTPPVITTTQSTAQLGQWYYICLVHDSNFGGKLYVNGNLMSEIQLPGELCPSTNNLYFGCDNILGFLNRFLNGALDDITIYDRPLTEQEIQNLYTGQCPTVSSNCSSLPSNLQQGLVGYWPFCGNANDESGNGNDGVVNGATLTEDRFGNESKAYGFDGNSDFINCGSSTQLESSELTISAWYACSAFNTQWNENCLLSNYTNQGFMLALNEGTQPQIRITTNEGNREITASTPSLNEWYHLVSVITPQYLKLYVNNNLVDSIEMGSAIFTNNDTLVMGKASWFENTAYYSGTLDDIGIWNRALTPEEVQELYTLDACTFTVYDTLTVYETVYDTVYTYETIYDTVTTYVTVTDTLLIDITFTGFEGQPSWLNTVTVFPNPASDHITIDYGNFALMAGYNTIITDAAGATVYSSSVNSQQVEIDINAWGATGVYYMMIYDLNGELVAVRQIVLE